MARKKRTIHTALITGASGMIGATLTRVLMKAGIRVYAVIRPDSLKTGNLPMESDSYTLIRADMADFGRISVPEKIDAVFHLAWAGAAGKGRNSLELQEENVRGSLALLKRSKELGAHVFVGAGSQAEYGIKTERLTGETPCEPETEYGKAKHRLFLKGNALAEELGIDFVWTRILSVYGPYDNDYSMVMRAVHAFLNKEPFPCTKGDQIWDYLYAGDAAAYLYRLALYGESGKAYVLSGGTEAPLRTYIEAIRDSIDPGLTIGFGEIPYYEHQVMYLAGDMTETIKATGYQPKTPFEKGIRSTVRWARKRSGKTS